MTREEAVLAIHKLARELYQDGDGNRFESLFDALTTLAPAVRYEPPTPKEVGYRQKAWGYSCGSWHLVTGTQLRHFWEGSRWGSYTAWLPISAIPKGGA